MGRVKSIIRYIIAIIIAISIIGIVVINIASTTILSKDYVLNQLDKANYYTTIHDLAISTFENYIYQSGLDETVLENILSEDKVKEDTEKIISAFYGENVDDLNIQEVKDQMKENIYKTVESIYNRKPTATEEKSIESLIDKLANEYSKIVLQYDIEEQVSNMYTKAIKYVDLGKIALFVVAIAGFAVLLILSLKDIYKAFTTSGVAVAVAGTFLLVTMLIVNMRVNIQTITILNDGITTLIRNIVSGIMSTINTNGIILLVIGLVLMLIANLLHNVINPELEENEKNKKSKTSKKSKEVGGRRKKN